MNVCLGGVECFINIDAKMIAIQCIGDRAFEAYKIKIPGKSADFLIRRKGKGDESMGDLCVLIEISIRRFCRKRARKGFSDYEGMTWSFCLRGASIFHSITLIAVWTAVFLTYTVSMRLEHCRTATPSRPCVLVS